MPLVLDGTNGVSGVDGTASNPAIEGTDSNTGIFYPAADTVAIGTGGTERLRVDSSGRLLLGTSTAGSNQGMTIYNATQGELRLQNATTGNGVADGFQLAVNGSDAYVFNRENAPLYFGTNDQTRMTLDASGKFLVGTTTSPNQQAVIYRTSSNTGNGALLLDGNGSYAGLQFALSGTLRGSISSDSPDFYITHAGNINFRTGSGDHVGGTTRATITGGGILSLQSSTANGVYLQSAADFAMASNATVAITSFTAGACLILVYEPATGDGGMFWANFTAVVTKVAGDGSATDAGSTFAVYKSAASHTTTIKNRYGVSKNFRIAVYSAQANP